MPPVRPIWPDPSFRYWPAAHRDFHWKATIHFIVGQIQVWLFLRENDFSLPVKLDMDVLFSQVC
jgi:hypothetical protein